MLTRDYRAEHGFCHEASLRLALDPKDRKPIEDNPQLDMDPGDVHGDLTPPFGRIEMSRKITDEPGVYIIEVDDEPRYVGKAVNLRRRWSQYKRISKSKCHRDTGNFTNCKVNHEILDAYKNGKRVDLWFRRDIPFEEYMIRKLKPAWNSR